MDAFIILLLLGAIVIVNIIIWGLGSWKDGDWQR